MKAVIVLLALVALVVCQNPPDCTTFITVNGPADGWSEATAVNQTIATPTTSYTLIQCWQLNATNPDSTVNNTYVIAGRIDEDSESTNTTNIVVWNTALELLFNQTITNEDDVDSYCYVIPNGTQALWVGVYATAANTTVDVWTQITDEPSCGADAELSGGSSFWIWIIVAVVIVVIIAVIIAGAGAFVYYQKKKKGQAKLYEDS